MEDMRGLFFIMKGQYRKGVEPSYVNRISGEVGYVGGYDPEASDTERWYMLIDRKTFTIVACGSDLDKVAHSLYSIIKRYKGQAKKFFKHISDTTSDDYYEVTYLHHTPLDSDKRAKKAEGRCPRTSPVMRELYKEIDRQYGDYYIDMIEDMENKAYSELVDERPVNKSRKLVNKARKSMNLTPVETSKKTPLRKKETPVSETPKMVLKPKRRMVKLLK